MNNKNGIIASFALLTLTACGGGGGGGSAPAASPGGSAGASSSDPNKDVSSAAELVVPKEFKFSSSYELPVDVNISGTTTERAFLSICPNYTAKNGGGFDIDYQNCLIRTPFSNGTYTGNLTVTNDKTKLIAAIWFFGTGRDAMFSEWSKDSGTDLIIR